MGFMPTFQKDPQAPAKLRPGIFALVYIRAVKGAAIRGGHVWFEVNSLDREEGTWTGRPVKAPAFPSGISRTDPTTFTLDQAEAVSSERPDKQ